MKIKCLFNFLILLSSVNIYAQNCSYFLLIGDTLKQKACLKAEEKNGLYQYHKDYQLICDEALAIDSTFWYPYRSKATAFLKSGDMYNYERLMKKAEHYDQREVWPDRGWCRFSFFRNARGALDDFLKYEERFGPLKGYTVEGDYHLLIAKALCLKYLGDVNSAIEIIENYLKSTNDRGLFNCLHLGVCYLELGNFEKAVQQFENQLAINEIAETHYYMARIFFEQKKLKDALVSIQKCEELCTKKIMMKHDYTFHEDKIYLSQIQTLRSKIVTIK